MAEFAEMRCEDMIPELEQMERIKLFDKNEIRGIAKKLREYEYKIQRNTKCKEHYVEYIHYEMDLLKLIKQRRDKYGITQKKSDIDFAIANKMNNLYKDAIFKFQDIRFWIAYIKFCKHVHFHSNISHMIGRMLQAHRDEPKCWQVAACWELEENNNKQNARQFLRRGLHIHPDSQLLHIEAYRLELNDYVSVSNNTENAENQEDNPASTVNGNEMPLPLKKAYQIYQQAVQRINDIKFIIKLLTITEEYANTEKLQKKIVSDMIREYAHEALMWDKMADRELQGLVQPSLTDTPMELDNSEQASLRDRVTSCNKVYQAAVKKIKTEEMWSFYIKRLLDINKDLQSLPNFKRKLLKNALAQAHKAKKLKEEYYSAWIKMLSAETGDENAQKILNQVLCGATDAVPNSVSLWHERVRHLLLSGQEEEAAAIYPKATEILGEKALPLWRMRILHVQTKNSEKTEEAFQAALKAHPLIARDIKSTYIEWLVLTKSIRAARKAYDSLCLQQPFSLKFHKKMASLEVMQPDVSLKHARRPHELATHQFGNNDKTVWIDYIKFEMKYGDPKKVGEIHARAMKNLERSLTYSFIADYTRITCKPDSMNS